MIYQNKVIGVLDIDSPVLDRFDIKLEEFAIQVVNELIKRWD